MFLSGGGCSFFGDKHDVSVFSSFNLFCSVELSPFCFFNSPEGICVFCLSSGDFSIFWDFDLVTLVFFCLRSGDVLTLMLSVETLTLKKYLMWDWVKEYQLF